MAGATIGVRESLIIVRLSYSQCLKSSKPHPNKADADTADTSDAPWLLRKHVPGRLNPIEQPHGLGANETHITARRVFAMYQIMLGGNIIPGFETNELRNPRPTQPKKK